MILFQQEISGSLLMWETTAHMRQEGLMGLKEQIIKANGMRGRLQENLGSEDYLVVGYTDEFQFSSIDEATLKVHKAGMRFNTLTIPLFLNDLFRQGFIGDGFYIVQFNSPENSTNP